MKSYSDIFRSRFKLLFNNQAKSYVTKRQFFNCFLFNLSFECSSMHTFFLLYSCGYFIDYLYYVFINFTINYICYSIWNHLAMDTFKTINDEMLLHKNTKKNEINFCELSTVVIMYGVSYMCGKSPQ